ncbi:MAG: hypothetical protein EPN97_18655 [Alphaproteobacteria bacterium]|nr:MAG: hypothetical protein EPN97_18655 [Alphaproteobacteria bacterium]
MWALSQLTLPAAYILAATGVCAAPPPPAVEMEFVNTPPVERNDLSGRQLGGFHISTTFAKSRNEIFTVGGLTISDFSPAYLVDFSIPADTVTGWPCLSVKDVKIKVNYAPTIYVASEFRAGGCRYKTTLQHEVRHVNTDIITFNEFLPVLRQAVQDAANGIGAVGPLKPENLIRERDKMVDRLKAALEAKVDEIEKIRFNRQQVIDTRQEYLRLSALCREEPLGQR